MKNWTAKDIPVLTGRVAVVTGTGGIGLEASLALARAGCEVVVAGRNPGKGATAVEAIRQQVRGANVSFQEVDLASLTSIARFADRLQARQDRLDLLVNNAAVMRPPLRLESADGYELQFATNYLGHFALTARLLPLLRRGREARVISVSSLAARQGSLNFQDLQAQTSYHPMRVYSQSKLACLMFALEMQRRSLAGDWGVTSLAAHPGIARTELIHNSAGRWSTIGIVRSLLWFLFQPAAQGALPLLFAATSRQARPGAYYGPDRLSETRGYPSLARVPEQALNEPSAARLWEISETLTRLKFVP